MRIEWESWNAEIEHRILIDNDSLKTEDEDNLYFQPESPDIVFTPVGIYYKESPNRPSNRWQCFTCHTDFDIANSLFSEVIDNIDGVEAYRPLGKYTFFIGFGKLFDPKDVRKKVYEEATRYVES